MTHPNPILNNYGKSLTPSPHLIMCKRVQSKNDHEMIAKNTIKLQFKIGCHKDVIKIMIKTMKWH